MSLDDAKRNYIRNVCYYLERQPGKRAASERIIKALHPSPLLAASYGSKASKVMKSFVKEHSHIFTWEPTGTHIVMVGLRPDYTQQVAFVPNVFAEKKEMSLQVSPENHSNQMITYYRIETRSKSSEQDQEVNNKGDRAYCMALNFEGVYPLFENDEETVLLSSSLALLKTEDGNPVMLIDPLVHGGSHEKLINVLTSVAEKATLIFVHDCHVNVKVLGKEFFEECFTKVIDAQLVYEYLSDDHSPFGSLIDVCQYFGVEEEQQLASTKRKTPQVDHTKWMERPLNVTNIHFAAEKVSLLHQAIPAMLKMIQEVTTAEFPLLDILCKATQLRIINALNSNMAELNVIAQRRRTFEFDVNHTLRSIELMQAEGEALLAAGRATQRQDRNSMNSKLEAFCNPDRLIDLLPEPFKRVLSEQVSFDQVATKACDIVFDLEREPYIINLSEGDSYEDDRYYFMRGHNGSVAAATAVNTVKRNHLDEITKQLVIGGDHRAGINGELHRISAVYNNMNLITGYTMRIGRHFAGNSYMFTDLLLSTEFRDKSILVLGPPGSGKTSVIREIARILSQKQNLWIVDTSNEIAGQGDVPHACVGRARRMMVPTIQEQHRVMIECVQNHTPRVMVIDEIGRKQEAVAAATCKSRGVRLIASAHGDLVGLVKNPELNSLIGGVQSVILGDGLASKRSDRASLEGGQDVDTKKSVAERKDEPTFDVIIELNKGEYNRCRVIHKVKDAVDRILGQRSFQTQIRSREIVATVNNKMVHEVGAHNEQQQELHFYFQEVSHENFVIDRGLEVSTK